MLWIDSVGGYLVLPQSRVVIGQADPERRVDVPIVAGIEGRHLELIRERETYVVVPHGSVSIGERRLMGPESLVSGTELSLGSGVVLKFERPHPLSHSARLSIVSRHRTRPWSDGVVLMADACLLGPDSRHHIRCSAWRSELVLHRRGGTLVARCATALEADGLLADGMTVLSPRSRLLGIDFSLSLEPVSGT